MFNYEWAANKIKLQFAVNDVKVSGLPITEEAIKKAYIRRAGQVLEILATPVIQATSTAETIVTVEDKEPVVPVIKKKGKK